MADVRTKCPYCLTNNSISVEPKTIVPQLVRCSANACQKLYLAVIKLVSKEYAITFNGDTV